MASFFAYPATAPNHVYLPYTPASFPANLAQLAVYLQQGQQQGPTSDIKPPGPQTILPAGQAPRWPLQENGIQQQQQM